MPAMQLFQSNWQIEIQGILGLFVQDVGQEIIKFFFREVFGENDTIAVNQVI